MTFGEKVRTERKRLGLTQTELAEKMGVSLRTISTWERDAALPRNRKTYEKLAEVLDVSRSYLLNDDEAFIMDASEKYGYRGKQGAEKLTREITGLFAGGTLEEEDMDALMFAVQKAYVDAKEKNKKYTPKKYLENEDAKDETK